LFIPYLILSLVSIILLPPSPPPFSLSSSLLQEMKKSDNKQRYAAPLMCAGGTMWAALREPGIRPGDRVAILGIGGLVSPYPSLLSLFLFLYLCSSLSLFLSL
jgi:hypothetical protein